jgi:hypothetical protein
MFFLQPGIETLQIQVPHPDVVRVLINPERMDFNITGARLLLALDGDRDSLSRNPTLTWLRGEKGWSWFEVKAQP